MGTSSHNGSDPARRPLRIGELARATGKTSRALHLYEELGIIQPVRRTSGGFRLYAPESIDRVAWIDKLHGLGLSLTQISAFVNRLARVEEGPHAMELVRQTFQEKLVEVRAAIGRLSALETDLVQGLTYLTACTACVPARAASECVTCTMPRASATRPSLVDGLHADVRPLRAAGPVEV